MSWCLSLTVLLLSLCLQLTWVFIRPDNLSHLSTVWGWCFLSGCKCLGWFAADTGAALRVFCCALYIQEYTGNWLLNPKLVLWYSVPCCGPFDTLIQPEAWSNRYFPHICSPREAFLKMEHMLVCAAWRMSELLPANKSGRISLLH